LAEGDLAWQLPQAIDQVLVAAGLTAKLGPRTLATVRHRVAVLSTAHRLKQVINPCEQPAIRTVLSKALLAACDDRLEGSRGRALLCFGFPAAAAGAAGYIFRLEHSKTQQAGVTVTSTPDKPVLDRAGLALQDWLEASGITEVAIFRRLWKQRIGPALSPAAVGEIVAWRGWRGILVGTACGRGS